MLNRVHGGAIQPHHIPNPGLCKRKKGQLTQMDKLPLFDVYACRNGQMRLHDLKIIAEIRICDISMIHIHQCCDDSQVVNDIRICRILSIR